MNYWVGLMMSLFWVCFIPCGKALDLGVQGSVYEIKEEGALMMIEQKLLHLEQSGEIARQQDALKKQALKSITQPKAVAGLKATAHPRTFEINLTVTVPFDIKDDEGNLIQPKGKHLNPLSVFGSRKSLLFLDGEDDKQIQWALSQYQDNPESIKLVLVNGSPLDLMEQHSIPFYFDQEGRLSQYFRLEQVPAKVYQHQDKLKVEEVKL